LNAYTKRLVSCHLKINNLFATATNRRLRIPFHINNVQEQIQKKRHGRLSLYQG
jgi:hypothetical protein